MMTPKTEVYVLHTLSKGYLTTKSSPFIGRAKYFLVNRNSPSSNQTLSFPRKFSH